MKIVGKNLSIYIIRLLLSLTWLIISLSALSAQIIPDINTRKIYDSIASKYAEKPDLEIFQLGLEGYKALLHEGMISNSGIITLIDFRKSGNEKRMWVIDLVDKKILYNFHVAHGRNSGELYPTKFSNTNGSNQSSLGFFATGAIYTGKHGTSLKLHGLEKGINDKAEQRAIVIHGAEYVSEEFIEKVGRLGRSFGCPAIPMGVHEKVIRSLADGTCLFIYYPNQEYMDKGLLSRKDQNNAITTLIGQ